MKDTLIVLVAVLGLSALVGGIVWLSPIPILNMKSTPWNPADMPERRGPLTEQEKADREVREAAREPMEIGDKTAKLLDRCGKPFGMAEAIEANGRRDIIEYRWTEGQPYDCDGMFFFENFRLVRIVR